VDEHAALTLKDMWRKSSGVNPFDFLARCMLPFVVGHFLLLPLPVVAAGAAAGFPAATLMANAVTNLVIADVVSNIHSFIVIATNHAGSDLYRFERGPARVNSGTWFMRQVVSSANFRTGGDANDFMHGWLNYQIEHHVWPNLSMLSYQKAAPELKAICEKHGVPYVQQNVFKRLGELVDIMIGKTSMRVYEPEWEKNADFVAGA
jgi:fatty acid desaturase